MNRFLAATLLAALMALALAIGTQSHKIEEGAPVEANATEPTGIMGTIGAGLGAVGNLISNYNPIALVNSTGHALFGGSETTTTTAKPEVAEPTAKAGPTSTAASATESQ